MSLSFIESLLEYKKIGVFSHIRPDGDAIGSQVAASIWLSKFSKNVLAFNDDAAPENINWLMRFFPIQKPTKELVDSCDAFLFLDGNSASRFGEFGEYIFKSEKPKFLIDHHPNPDGDFKSMLHSVKACSTAELVFQLFLNTNMDLLEKDAAMALYAGIVTDTGSFRFDSVNADVHTVVSEILRRGKFSPPEVHEKIYDNKNLNQVQLLGKALTTLEAPGDGRIGIIQIKKEFMEETGTSYADTEGFVAYALSLKGVTAAILFAELDKGIKLSLRSKRDLDCNVWANNFNGGGHVRAAGGWFYGSLEDAKKEVYEKGKELLALS